MQQFHVFVNCEVRYKVWLSYLWYQTDMNVTEILPLHFKLELPEGLDEWHALYVSNSPSQLQTHKHWQ